MLLMPSITAIVFNDRGEVLLQRSAETGDWWLIGGGMDPGEHPAECARREVLEECGVHVTVERIVGVHTRPLAHYANGDVVNYVSTTFVCRAIGGEARVNDDESMEVRYFKPDEVPELWPIDHMLLKLALSNDPRAHFESGE